MHLKLPVFFIAFRKLPPPRSDRERVERHNHALKASMACIFAILIVAMATVPDLYDITFHDSTETKPVMLVCGVLILLLAYLLHRTEKNMDPDKP